MNRNKFLLNLWVVFSAVVIVAEQAHASGAYNMQAFWRRPVIQATAAGGSLYVPQRLCFRRSSPIASQFFRKASAAQVKIGQQGFDFYT